MARRPNIVFIMADDLGYADVGCYGRPELATLNIDRIAARGVRLTQAYAISAVCSATRLALITGRYQYRLPLGLEEPLAGKTDIGLPPEHPTLPSLLLRSGYATALVGKWHLDVLPRFGPLKSGYQHFYGIRSGAAHYYSHQNTRGGHDLWEGDEQEWLPASRIAISAQRVHDRSAGPAGGGDDRISTRRTGHGRLRAIALNPTGSAAATFDITMGAPSRRISA